jgi:hypothetical protein
MLYLPLDCGNQLICQRRGMLPPPGKAATSANFFILPSRQQNTV